MSATVHTRQRTDHDGEHVPDGNTGWSCAFCTRAGSTPRSNNSVAWPCEPVKALRREAGLPEYEPASAWDQGSSAERFEDLRRAAPDGR